LKDTLFVIPARGGSKGVPRKNVKLLNGKPLICYSIDYARKFTTDDNICVSTDDEGIIKIVEDYGLKVPFKRPSQLATDNANTNDVLLHAYNFYSTLRFDKIVLLQPTSPFRKEESLKEALNIYSKDVDMVVSVFETESNPYYVLFEENTDGLLYKCKKSDITRRQDLPKVYELDGSIYLINVKSLLEKKTIGNFTTIKKVLMDKLHSSDIDTPMDWMYCEFLIEKGLIND